MHKHARVTSNSNGALYAKYGLRPLAVTVTVDDSGGAAYPIVVAAYLLGSAADLTGIAAYQLPRINNEINRF